MPAAPPESEAGLPVDVRTRFERFPATLKGAFVLSGADGLPHVARLESARVQRIPRGTSKPVPIGAVLVNVAPGRDLYVPFEASISDLEPGWFVVRSTVQVDGGRSFEFSGRPVCVPWPRSDVRRGTVKVDRPVEVGGSAFLVHRVELGAESAIVVWRGPDDPAASRAEAVLVADGTALEILPLEVLKSGGASSVDDRRTASYPVFRSVRSLGVSVRLGGAASPPAPVDLP